MELVVRDRQLEPVAEDAQLGLGELLGLVGDVASLDAGAERPALDRLGQDDRRPAAVLGGGAVGGVDLAVVVAATAEPGQLVVREVLDQAPQPRVGAEEVLADVGPAGHGELLELAVEGLVHLVDEDALDVAGQQVVPLAAPDDLDHVPAGAAEEPLQLLDDLAVAADRAVEALQVAVDHEGQVVEALAGGQRKGRSPTRARPSRRRPGTPRPGWRRCRPGRGSPGSGSGGPGRWPRSGPGPSRPSGTPRSPAWCAGCG